MSQKDDIWRAREENGAEEGGNGIRDENRNSSLPFQQNEILRIQLLYKSSNHQASGFRASKGPLLSAYLRVNKHPKWVTNSNNLISIIKLTIFIDAEIYFKRKQASSPCFKSTINMRWVDSGLIISRYTRAKQEQEQDQIF